MVTLAQFGNVPASLGGNAAATISILNEIFAAFPGRFRFTSGYRTPAQNAAANGVANSFHVQALAGDFVPIDGKYPAGEKEAIAAIVAKYGGEVIKHDAGSGLHYHIEPNNAQKTWLKTSGGGISTVTIAALGLIFILLITD